MIRLFAFIFVWMSLATASLSATHYVSKSGFAPYTEIQPAIDAAIAGDTILVAPSGSSYQGFAVDRQLMIYGAGCDTISGRNTRVVGPIRVQPGASNSQLSGLLVDFASAGLDSVGALMSIHSGVSAIEVLRCCFLNRYNAAGVNCALVWIGAQVGISLDACCFWYIASTNYSFMGINCPKDGSAITVRSSVFSGCDSGIINQNSSTTTVFTVRQCIFSDGGLAIYACAGSVENSYSAGAMLGASVNVAAHYCASAVTPPGGVGNLQVGIGTFGYWEQFNPYHSNFHLNTDSPLIDAGNPISPPDRDGSRADIGIYGGQTPYNEFGIPDYPFVIELEISATVPQNGVLHVGSTGRVGNGGGQ